jgi:alkylation response protein AidB-like acyl-CoA dehydrogenase
MDFSFTDEQAMVRDLARGILEKEVTPDRVKQIEMAGEWFDRPLWSTLAAAGLLGLVVPAELGGMGFGLPEACVLLHEVGRTVAPMPALPTLVLGALPIAAFGTAEQKERWLRPIAAGTAVLTGAMTGLAAPHPKPAVLARQEGSAWVLNGRGEAVPAAHLAERILVPATTDSGLALFLISPQANGVTLTRHETSTCEPVFTLALADVHVDGDDVLGGETAAGQARMDWVHDRAVVATCATQTGVTERALELTSEYAREREQFGVPIGSFQAVQHRLADCYIDLEAMRWVTWRAAWKLSAGQTATRETMVAKFWAAEGGARVANAAQHLHGGIGVDLDYPLHRYFIWTKALELSFGGATPQLARLGCDMAATGPPQEQLL